jgi:RecB family endonuclease NucS
MSFAAWRVIDGRSVRRLTRSTVQPERMLEDWIEEDPSLVLEGLVVVARQLVAGGAGRLDLLAVDPAGRWVVIEIKAGTLYRETVAQALDYVASLKALPVDRLRNATNAYLKGIRATSHASGLSRRSRTRIPTQPNATSWP